MSTVDELQSEISDLRRQLCAANEELLAVKVNCEEVEKACVFYKQQSAGLDSQLREISQANLENRLAFERIKAERNALWEVMKLHRDKHLVNLPDDGIPDPEAEE